MSFWRSTDHAVGAAKRRREQGTFSGLAFSGWLAMKAGHRLQA